MTMITTAELRTSMLQVGHDTFNISASTAIKKSANRGKLTNRNENHTPTANTIAGNPYLIAGWAARVSLSLQQPIKNANKSAPNVTWRTMRP